MALRLQQCIAPCARKVLEIDMAKLMKTRKWTFSLTLLVTIAGATLLGGVFGNRLFGSTM